MPTCALCGASVGHEEGCPFYGRRPRIYVGWVMECGPCSFPGFGYRPSEKKEAEEEFKRHGPNCVDPADKDDPWPEPRLYRGWVMECPACEVKYGFETMKEASTEAEEHPGECIGPPGTVWKIIDRLPTPPERPLPSPASPPTRAGDPRFCSKCGALLPADKASCPQCGRGAKTKRR